MWGLFLFIFISYVGKEFSLSSIESNLLKENTKQQICVNGWNDTVVWAIWADVEIKAVAQPNDAIYVVSETRYVASYFKAAKS